jgi:uncharacterized protein YuzE
MWSFLRRIRGGSYPSTGGKVAVYLDESVDAATLVVSDNAVARTVRVEGIGFVDLDDHDNIVAIEVLGASMAMERLKQMERERQPSWSLYDELRASASRFLEQARERVENGETAKAEGTGAARRRQL